MSYYGPQKGYYPSKVKQARKKFVKEKRKEMNKVFDWQLELIAKVRGEKYSVLAVCKNCGRVLESTEILEGFNQDPNDFTTACPKCGQRFNPSLDRTTQQQVLKRGAFYCPIQTLHRLPDLQHLPPKQMAASNSDVFHSAIAHFGSLKSAFSEIDIDYKLETIGNWKEKVKEFLGKMPDSAIAKCVNVSAVTIGKLRHSLGIARFSKNKAVDKIEDN